MEIWIVFILAGLVAGFFAGLLGIGGGFVVVPVLIMVFTATGIAGEFNTHLAIGTSLLCICFTSIVSARSHHLQKAVDWRLFKLISPGLIIGSAIGAFAAAGMDGKYLTLFFIVGAILTAIYLLSNHQPKPQPEATNWPYFFFGIFTGCVSALIGIGGGSLVAPFLAFKGKSMVAAVGTAAACGFPIAVVGAAGYGWNGWGLTDIDLATGYLYWPAFLGIVAFSSISAPIGAKLAHYISERRLKQVFATFLFLTSAQILYSQWF